MRVLIACEFSGIVRDEFAKRGHDAWSVDLLPSERPGQHIQADAIATAYAGHWDLMVAHPPCTHLAVSGAAWFAKKQSEQRDALRFIWALMRAPIPRIAIENPVSVISTVIRKPDQIVQPYWFGHIETKRTCLWLKGLPNLTPTNLVKPDGHPSIHYMSPGTQRWKDRSRTFPGLARAMAEQWG